MGLSKAKWDELDPNNNLDGNLDIFITLFRHYVITKKIRCTNNPEDIQISNKVNIKFKKNKASGKLSFPVL